MTVTDRTTECRPVDAAGGRSPAQCGCKHCRRHTARFAERKQRSLDQFRRRQEKLIRIARRLLLPGPGDKVTVTITHTRWGEPLTISE